MTGKQAGTLLAMMSQIEHFTLARVWNGLTDDEFFWEPFTTSWSIRRQDQCRTPNPFGAGALNEVGHHGTQIGALRDVYAWRRSATQQ